MKRLSILLLACLPILAEARPIKVTATQSQCVNGKCSTASSVSISARGVQDAVVSVSAPAAATLAESDALAEVNVERAKRGLRPYVYDPGLTAGAMHVAKFRASRLIHGHTLNDFQGLPVGVTAKASGCGALEPSFGWGTCCTYDRYTYAGAAKVMGRDGRFFMQIFVR